MSLNRYAAKRDISEPPIVEALEAAGYTVQRLAKPVDLAVRKAWYPRGVNFLLECKTPQGKVGTLRVRKEQVTQNAFVADGGAVKVGTPEAALEALHAFEIYQGGPYGGP